MPLTIVVCKATDVAFAKAMPPQYFYKKSLFIIKIRMIVIESSVWREDDGLIIW
jgi:hypothetical protein